jgi:uncharacterized paraquat-inducible protein A
MPGMARLSGWAIDKAEIAIDVGVVAFAAATILTLLVGIRFTKRLHLTPRNG